MEGRRGISAMCIHLLTLVGSQFIDSQSIHSDANGASTSAARLCSLERFLSNVLEFVARRCRPNDEAS